MLRLFVGAVITLLVAWACVLWTPSRSAFDPFQNPSQTSETVDPDGEKGLHYVETGFGWTCTYLRGFGGVWASPYGGTYHRAAGWPFDAMRSRVEVLDSQVSGRFSEGEPEPEVKPQRRRWELPVKEIFYRGLASKDLPAWLQAQPDRRLPLIPMPLGFAGDAVVYALMCHFVEWGGRFVRRRVLPKKIGRANTGFRLQFAGKSQVVLSHRPSVAHLRH